MSILTDGDLDRLSVTAFLREGLARELHIPGSRIQGSFKIKPDPFSVTVTISPGEQDDPIGFQRITYTSQAGWFHHTSPDCPTCGWPLPVAKDASLEDVLTAAVDVIRIKMAYSARADVGHGLAEPDDSVCAIGQNQAS